MKGLGEQIRKLRKARHLTLVEIAKATDIDQATISRIENGRMTGTLESHQRIASALDIRLPDLYQSVADPAAMARERRATQRLETLSPSGKTVSELLTTGILQKKMLPVLLKLKPGGKTESETLPHFSERFIYILKGSVEVTLGTDDKRLLGTGESLYFNGTVTHRFSNRLRQESWLLSILTPVTV